MGTTCGSLRLRLHKPHVAIVRPRALTSQSSVAVTHYIPITTHFTYPGGLESWVEIICSGDWTRTSCTHEWTCAGATNDLTNWASQTDIVPLSKTLESCIKGVKSSTRIKYTWPLRHKQGTKIGSISIFGEIQHAVSRLHHFAPSYADVHLLRGSPRGGSECGTVPLLAGIAAVVLSSAVTVHTFTRHSSWWHSFTLVDVISISQV